jgi:hypothetical protein
MKKNANAEKKNKNIDIEFNGKKYRYEYHTIKSLPAETANEIMQWYNDAKNRQKQVNLKEVHRSDLGEVKDTVVAHLVREVSEKGVMLDYDSAEARSSVKEFMMGLPHDEFSSIKDEIIKDFFLSQGKLHLAMQILREEPKKSSNPESLMLLAQLITASKNLTESPEKKNLESAPSKAVS